jgi:2-dehydro-3-deoxygalactonokinase
LAAAAEWVAVDWGTSNVRAWGIDANGDISFSSSSEKGMGKISRADYPGVLDELLGANTLPARADVLICGMAGARQGWMEAPYVDTPATLTGLHSAGVVPPLEHSRLSARILPGVCQRGGREDVMRGEETQVLGLLKLIPGYEGAVIMPGTHSKWVRIEGGRIVTFTTAMTGELYDVLGAHSVLRHSLGGDREGPALEDGISAGLDDGLESPELLTGMLFRTRAASLLSGKGADWCSGYLSGLLVGTEIGGHRDWVGKDAVPLIGSARLQRPYGAALKRIGADSVAIDATDATLAGLTAARAQA